MPSPYRPWNGNTCAGHTTLSPDDAQLLAAVNRPEFTLTSSVTVTSIALFLLVTLSEELPPTVRRLITASADAACFMGWITKCQNHRFHSLSVYAKFSRRFRSTLCHANHSQASPHDPQPGGFATRPKIFASLDDSWVLLKNTGAGC